MVRHPNIGGETQVQFLVWPDFESHVLSLEGLFKPETKKKLESAITHGARSEFEASSHYTDLLQ